MRRSLTLTILAAATAILAACSSSQPPTPPKKGPGAKVHTYVCLSGYTTSDGRFVCTDSSES